MTHLCFAPENSRRLAFWNAALPQDCHQISYIDLMNDNFHLDSGEDYIVRIESPGEDDRTTELFESIGLNGKGTQKKFGQFIHYDAWYMGWKTALDKIKELGKAYSFYFINAPDEIALVFDKRATHKFLDGEVEMPKLIGLCRTVRQLKDLLSEGYQSIFIKARYGSSASGVIALRKHKEQVIAYSSLIIKKGELFNSLRLQKYNSWQQIEQLFQLADTEFIVEEWIPKLQHQGQAVDFRVLLVDGKAEFVVPRKSKHMITNIHLGGEKMTANAFPPEIINQVKSFAEMVSSHFSTLSYSGMDILLTPNKRPYLLEVNAFGDMLLNIQNEEGLGAYELELRSILKKAN